MRGPQLGGRAAAAAGARKQLLPAAAGGWPCRERCLRRDRRRASLPTCPPQEHPTADAVVSLHQGLRLTYSEFHEAVEAAARGLLALGVAARDRVGIWSPNCAEWVVLQFATAKVGAILVRRRGCFSCGLR